MKRYVLAAVLLVAGLVAVGGARADEDEEESFEKAMQDVALQNKQLDLQERQSELDFQNEMQELDIDRKRAEFGKQCEMMKQMPPRGPQMGRSGGLPGGCKGCPGMGKLGMQPPDGCKGCPRMGVPGGHPSPHHGKGKACGAIFVVCAVIHILLAMWVYQDIRKRNTGSGLWIVITLLTGLLGALVYAIVRIGDKQTV